MKNIINLIVWFMVSYVLIEVAIQHLKPFWIFPVIIIFVLNALYFFTIKGKDGKDGK